MTHIPTDIAEAVVRMGAVEWGAVGPKTDEEHTADFADSLGITRAHFGVRGARHLHGLYLAGTDTVLCHTGTSPNSAINAQALAGAWNWLLEESRAAINAQVGRHAERQDPEEGLGPKDEHAVPKGCAHPPVSD